MLEDVKPQSEDEIFFAPPASEGSEFNSDLLYDGDHCQWFVQKLMKDERQVRGECEQHRFQHNQLEEQIFEYFLYHLFDQSMNYQEAMLYWVFDLEGETLTDFTCLGSHGEECDISSNSTYRCELHRHGHLFVFAQHAILRKHTVNQYECILNGRYKQTKAIVIEDLSCAMSKRTYTERKRVVTLRALTTNNLQFLVLDHELFLINSTNCESIDKSKTIECMSIGELHKISSLVIFAYRADLRKTRLSEYTCTLNDRYKQRKEIKKSNIYPSGHLDG
nr:unnamed protein product [Spirometra erinaceieuropaei]